MRLGYYYFSIYVVVLLLILLLCDHFDFYFVFGLVCPFILMFFFFKQKTAYELRISDWSSDVCSSDLGRGAGCHSNARAHPARTAPPARRENGRSASPGWRASRRRSPPAASAGSGSHDRLRRRCLRPAHRRRTAGRGSAAAPCGPRTDAAEAATGPVMSAVRARRAFPPPAARRPATRSTGRGWDRETRRWRGPASHKDAGIARKTKIPLKQPYRIGTTEFVIDARPRRANCHPLPAVPGEPGRVRAPRPRPQRRRLADDLHRAGVPGAHAVAVPRDCGRWRAAPGIRIDRKSTRLNSSH